MEFRRVGFETRQTSPLCRKGRGSHPVLGSGLKQRDGQRENVGAIPCGCPVGTGLKPVHGSRINSFVNNHLLDPNIIFRRSIG